MVNGFSRRKPKSHISLYPECAVYGYTCWEGCGLHTALGSVKGESPGDGTKVNDPSAPKAYCHKNHLPPTGISPCTTLPTSLCLVSGESCRNAQSQGWLIQQETPSSFLSIKDFTSVVTTDPSIWLFHQLHNLQAMPVILWIPQEHRSKSRKDHYTVASSEWLFWTRASFLTVCSQVAAMVNMLSPNREEKGV